MNIKTITSKSGTHELTFYIKSHRYILDGEIVPGATTVNRKGGPIPEKLLNWFIQNGRGGKQKSTAAADIGTIVHKYAELCCAKSDLTPHLERIKSHKDKNLIENCTKLFDTWYSDNLDEIEGIELLVCSPKLRYGGIIDRLVYSKKWGRVIDDYKTSTGFFIDNFIQAAGYAIAAKEWLGKSVDSYRILLFPKTGEEFHTLVVSEDGWFLDDNKVEKSVSTRLELQQQFVRNVESMYFHKMGNTMFDKIYIQLKNGGTAQNDS